MFNVDVNYVQEANPIAAADIASATQTGMTSQGYTTTRAPYLDTVNTNLDIKLSDANTALAGDISTVASAVSDANDIVTDISDNQIGLDTVPSTAATEGTIEYILAWLKNWINSLR